MASQSVTEQPAGLAGASLRVYLLGPLRVEWAGRPLVMPRRQPRALLYRLAARLQPVPREHLCFLFWPDIPESTARRNFTRLLTHLRRALPRPEVLLVSDDHVGLDSDKVWSDAAVFEQLCAALTPIPLHPLPPLPKGEGEGGRGVRGEVLRQVVDLYRGPFLAGFSLPECPEFEAWSSQERYTLERLYLEALDALVEDCTAQAAYDEAITYAQRYLESDDLAEKVHRHLIELYALTDHRREAQRQYERCAAVLERELGVSPLPETRAAYQAAVLGRPVAQHPAPPPTWTTLPSLKAPLVGRDEALNRLKHAYARARSGQGGVLLISGEPGIGKSRLLQDFVTELAGEATVVVGAGHEAEQGLPYWPLVQALQPHLPVINWAALDVEPFYLAEVARLWPRLRTLLPDLAAPSPGEPGQEQARLFQALVHWLLRLAAHHPPLVLCLDDLHWADTATLSWLEYLARHLQRAPVLVLGAYRTGEGGKVAALRVALLRLGVLHAVRLEGLPQTEVLRLIRHLSGQASGAQLFSQRLLRETGGNPFFVLESLRAMFEAGILWQDETGWRTSVDETTEDYRELPLPDTVYGAIRDRLSRLRPQARQVLEAGAVIGHQFDFDLVRVTSGRREREVTDAVDALLARQVISEHDGGYWFNHDLIRAVVYQDLGYGRRRLLHRRAGEALEKLHVGQAARYAAEGPTSEIAVQLARHFQAAAIPEKAAHYMLQAGNRALQLCAHEEAMGWFTRGLSLLEILPATPGRVQQELALQIPLGMTLLTVKGYAAPEVQQTYARARELCQQIGETPQLFPVLMGLGVFYLVRGELQTARELSAQVLRLAQSVRDPALLMEANLAVGVTSYFAGELAPAQEHLKQGIALYDPQECPSPVFFRAEDPKEICLSYTAWSLWLLGYPDQALEKTYEAVALARERDQPFGLTGTLDWAAIVHQLRGEVEAAQERVAEALVLSTKHGFAFRSALETILQGWALAEQGTRARKAGQREKGIAQMQQGLAALSATGAQLSRPYYLALLAEVYGQGGQSEQGLKVLAEALEAIQQSGERNYEAELYRLKGELLLIQEAGREITRTAAVEAEDCFHQAIEVARWQSAKSLELRAVMSLSRLWHAQGSGDKKEKACQMLAEIYDWFTEGFDTPDLQEAKALLEELS
jgi:DNA-binding SARP family transcriptional activator/predicted ATPase